MLEYNYNDFLTDLKMGREFEFVIDNQTYNISIADRLYIFSFKGESIAYKSIELLTENLRIQGKDIKTIFESGKIEDYTIY